MPIRHREPGAWMDRADPLSLLLWRQCDVITRVQALEHFSRSAIANRLRTGRWQPVHRGIYLTRDAPVSVQQRRWIGYLSVPDGHRFLAGPTAAELCGLRGYQTGAVHLLVPAHRQVHHPPPGLVVHRSTRLRSSEVNPLGLPPYTTAARSLIDAAQWAGSDDRARALITAGFQQRLVTGDDLRAVLDRLGRVRRRALILSTVEEASGGAHSLPEVQFIRHLRAARLPIPTLQYRRCDVAGTERYLDGYYVQWRLHIEIDGMQHLEVRGYWQDMHRQNALWIAGDRVLRFPAWAVRHRPDDVMAQVRAALVAAGWTGAEGQNRGQRRSAQLSPSTVDRLSRVECAAEEPLP